MNNNDAIIRRIKGVPSQKGTLKDKHDPSNPNKPEANDNDPDQQEKEPGPKEPG